MIIRTDIKDYPEEIIAEESVTYRHHSKEPTSTHRSWVDASHPLIAEGKFKLPGARYIRVDLITPIEEYISRNNK